MSYPLHLDLTGREVLIAGGGPVAARRARGALEAGAILTVVAPEVCEELAELIAEGVTWRRRGATPADVTGCWLVHAATGDREVDRSLADAAQRDRIWCVTSGDVTRGSARTPAVVRRGDLVVGVSSVGDPDPGRATALTRAIGVGIDTGSLPLRRRRGHSGRVILVGGGPGDSELITVAGRRALATADVVVHDRLGPSLLLDELAPDVVLVDVGKTAGNHPLSQGEINLLLVEHARAGSTVVRLKGGDPFVFGRGFEEAAACRAAGVEVDVVPGVSSAFAVPLAAGIPVTSRGLARGVLVMTGHELDGRPDPAAVADAASWCQRGNTLVVLMGLSTLPWLCAELRSAGLAPTTPAAVISHGTTPRQRGVRAPLASIARAATDAGLEPPAIIVMGAVVGLAGPGPSWAPAPPAPSARPTPDRSAP